MVLFLSCVRRSCVVVHRFDCSIAVELGINLVSTDIHGERMTAADFMLLSKAFWYSEWKRLVLEYNFHFQHGVSVEWNRGERI